MATVTIIYTYPMYWHPGNTPRVSFATEGHEPIDNSGLDVHQEEHKHFFPAGFTLGENNCGELLAWRGPWAYELAWNHKTKLPILREDGRTDGHGCSFTLASAE